MQYKTITLELIREQKHLHAQLKASRTLLATMERHALLLKERHLALMESLRRMRPHAAREQISGEALELAIQELREGFACGSVAERHETATLPPEAMTNARPSHRTPPV
jgi:hypothetical protein